MLEQKAREKYTHDWKGFQSPEVNRRQSANWRISKSSHKDNFSWTRRNNKSKSNQCLNRATLRSNKDCRVHNRMRSKSYQQLRWSTGSRWWTRFGNKWRMILWESLTTWKTCRWLTGSSKCDEGVADFFIFHIINNLHDNLLESKYFWILHIFIFRLRKSLINGRKYKKTF